MPPKPQEEKDKLWDLFIPGEVNELKIKYDV